MYQMSTPLDNALRHLLGTASFTRENSDLGSSDQFELKIMFKLPWVFSKLSVLSSHCMKNCRTLLNYMQTNQENYVCSDRLVLTRELWNRMPNELDVMLGLVKILHRIPDTTMESLWNIVKVDSSLNIRLRTFTSLYEFFRRYSDYFDIDYSGIVTTSIKSRFLSRKEMEQATKVNSLTAIQLIQVMKRQNKPIDLQKTHDFLKSIGYGFSMAEFSRFTCKFYNTGQTYPQQIPQIVKLRTVTPSIKFETKRNVREMLKRCPLKMERILKELHYQGVSLSESSLESFIIRHFPNYLIKDGIVIQGHKPFMASVKRILTRKCPISITELRMTLITQGVALSRMFLSEMIVKNLERYFITQGHIYFLDLRSEQAEFIADFVLQKLHLIVKDDLPVSLEELLGPLATKGIQITTQKLELMIREFSTIYECRENFLFSIEEQLPNSKIPESNCLCSSDDQLQVIDSLQSGIDLVKHFKPSNANQSNTIADSNEKTLLKVEFLDDFPGKNEILGALENIVVTEEVMGLVPEPHLVSDHVPNVPTNLGEPSTNNAIKTEAPDEPKDPSLSDKLTVTSKENCLKGMNGATKQTPTISNKPKERMGMVEKTQIATNKVPTPSHDLKGPSSATSTKQDSDRRETSTFNVQMEPSESLDASCDLSTPTSNQKPDAISTKESICVVPDSKSQMDGIRCSQRKLNQEKPETSSNNDCSSHGTKVVQSSPEWTLCLAEALEFNEDAIDTTKKLGASRPDDRMEQVMFQNLKEKIDEIASLIVINEVNVTTRLQHDMDSLDLEIAEEAMEMPSFGKASRNEPKVRFKTSRLGPVSTSANRTGKARNKSNCIVS